MAFIPLAQVPAVVVCVAHSAGPEIGFVSPVSATLFQCGAAVRGIALSDLISSGALP
jgi:hypothetical protein